VTKSGHRLQISDMAGVETIALSTPKSNRLVMTEKADETGRPAVVLHTDGDIILSAPKGRIHLQSKLQSKEVGTNGAVAAVLPPSSPPLTGSCTEKMERAISRAPLAQGVLNALGGPKGIAIALGTMAGAWAVSQVTPAGWAADIAGALMIVGLAVAGSEIASGLKGLYDFWQFTCKQAQSEADLDHAGKLFADSVAKVGVNTLLAILDAKGLGRLKGARPPVEEEVPAGRFRTPDASVLANTEINGIKPVRVRPGTNGKVAVIGRSMNDAVNPYAQGLAEQGYDVETFDGDKISDSARNQWKDLKDKFSPDYVPDDQVQQSQLFQENQSWASKLASKIQGMHSSKLVKLFIGSVISLLPAAAWRKLQMNLSMPGLMGLIRA